MLDEVFGKSFVYRRGAATVPITAILSSRQVEGQAERGVRDTWNGVAFVCQAADLVLDGSRVTPQRDDEVLEPIAGGYRAFTVLPLPDKRVFEPLDAEGFQIAVFAKETGTE